MDWQMSSVLNLDTIQKEKTPMKIFTAGLSLEN